MSAYTPTQRYDTDLAFLLRYENIAWYENGVMRILDRRIYPIKTEFVTCTDYRETVQAIKDMVTQSEGPYLAAAMGMALACFQALQKKSSDIIPYMEKAAYELSHARPTTVEQMKTIVSGSLQTIKQNIQSGVLSRNVIEAAFEYAFNYVNNNYKKYTLIGEHTAALIAPNSTVMTQCFGGTIVGTMLRSCKQSGKNISIICAETRPYFQGSRLTASVACDMGFPVTVISDNMCAFTMKTKKVDMFTSASDVITLDGHIINKVGTFQMALAAHYYKIPYYVTGTPDCAHPDTSRIKIEERDGEAVLKALDTKVTMDGVAGYYPAFDITPPELCTGIVTDLGVYAPRALQDYLKAAHQIV
ncbi:s-methyl-5-thioribose-1-phosphate isomerase [Treponema lecithinolyticum]|uniref:s-methyl-5-thioribose-1-phosphate isomerase n=1 Tax=Treponema lecithinolyticum TaxID=53418 RepID=UPI003FA218B0